LVVAILLLLFSGVVTVRLGSLQWNGGSLQWNGTLSLDTHALTQNLRSPDAKVRDAAAQTLAQQEAAVSLPIFLELTRDPRVEVRALGFRNLASAWVNPRRVIPVLAEATGDPEERIRIEATRALGLIAASLAHSVGSMAANPGGLEPGLRAKAISTLRERIKGQEKESTVRAEAAKALGQFGPDRAVADVLSSSLADPDRGVRLAVASALLMVRGNEDPVAVQALLTLLGDPEPVADRRMVLDVLETSTDAVLNQAVTILGTLLGKAELAVRPDVVECLTSLGPRGSAALPAFEELWKGDQDPEMRAEVGLAIVAIEGSDKPRSVEILLAIIADPAVSEAKRFSALEQVQVVNRPALSKITSHLIRQLADPVFEVRRVALGLLSGIIDENIRAELPDPNALK